MARVEVSEADRGVFRDRFKAAVRAAKTSAKKLEEQLGLAKGSFLKVYKGQLPLTDTLLIDSAKALNV